MKQRSSAWLGQIVGILLVPAAQAASFDCAKATTPVEKAICQSPVLSALDDEVAKLYARRLQFAGIERDSAISAQRKWLREDRNWCKDEQCIALSSWQQSMTLRTTLERSGFNAADIPQVAANGHDLEKLVAGQPPVAADKPSAAKAPSSPASPTPASTDSQQASQTPVPPIYGDSRNEYPLPAHTASGITVEMGTLNPAMPLFTVSNRTDLAAAMLKVRCASATRPGVTRNYDLVIGREGAPLSELFMLPDSETSRVFVLEKGRRVTTATAQPSPWMQDERVSCEPLVAVLPTKEEVAALNKILREGQDASRKAYQVEMAKYADPVGVLARAGFSIAPSDPRCGYLREDFITRASLAKEQVQHFGVDGVRKGAYQQVETAKAIGCLPRTFP